jgi:hypothetical protein
MLQVYLKNIVGHPLFSCPGLFLQKIPISFHFASFFTVLSLQRSLLLIILKNEKTKFISSIKTVLKYTLLLLYRWIFYVQRWSIIQLYKMFLIRILPRKRYVYLCSYDLFQPLLSLWHTHGFMKCMCICMYVCIFRNLIGLLGWELDPTEPAVSDSAL